MDSLATAPIGRLLDYEEKIRVAMLGSDKHTRRKLEWIRTQVLEEVHTRVQ